MYGRGGAMGGGGGGSKAMRLVGRRLASRVTGATLREHAAPPSSSQSSSSWSNQRLDSTLTNNGNNLDRSPSSPYHSPLSSNSNHYHRWSSAFPPEDYEFVSLHENADGLHLRLSAPPSVEEVADAVSALTEELGGASYYHFQSADAAVIDAEEHAPLSCRQFCRVSSVGGDLDWLEPSPAMFSPVPLQSSGSHNVLDAFQLLRTDPSIQKMVLSLSSDKAVWDAVINNEAVRELRDTFFPGSEAPGNNEESGKVEESPNPALSVIKYIFEGTKSKLLELYESITMIMERMIKPPATEKASGAMNEFEGMVRASFFLSIVVLLVVVALRSQS